MKLFDDRLSISPTDLAYFLSCRHRTALELSVAHDVRQRPKWDDPLLEVLFKLGLEHEERYVESLRASASRFVSLADIKSRDEAVAGTLDAMRAGADVIVQAALESGRFYGRPDVLMRCDRPSPAFGEWSYEVADTKLARETRGGTILQLGLYCEMLESAQGLAPDSFHVVTPAAPGPAAPRLGHDDSPSSFVQKRYRFHDYAAYFRLLKARLEAAVALGYEQLADDNYPEPVDHCDICPWSPRCRHRRRDDDHLSLVAGISRMQRRELTARDVITVESLAKIGDPFPFQPTRGSVETYERVRDQAHVQVETRKSGKLVYELIPPPPPPGLLEIAEAKSTEPAGFARLPEPSPGDVFLDLEGDPLAGEAGREYLFGWVAGPLPNGDGAPGLQTGGEDTYHGAWALSPADERAAFESLVDLLMARLAADPGMHIYHYAPYEPSAMKRLMGRHATREQEIDLLLRGRRFVDLYAVVRQGVRAGVERYSIKNLEPLYGFTRDVDLRDANRALRVMEQALETDSLHLISPEIRRVVEGYNRDDCVSTLHLRDWLEARRAELLAQDHSIPRPPSADGDPSPKLDERAKAVEALRSRLLALGARRLEESAPSHERSGRSLDRPDASARLASPEHTLAYLLDFHRREDKAGWWEYFRLRELPEEDLFEEPRALAGLEFHTEVEQVKRSFVHRYTYPVQEMEIRRKDTLKTPDGRKFADVVAIDRHARTVDIFVGPSKRADRPTALFAHDHVSSGIIEDALFALGERAADAGGVGRLPDSPARALLARSTPTLASTTFGPPAVDAELSTTDYAVSIVNDLDHTVLAIQGPPGTGKTYTGARMICELVKAGRRVGVTATSHKVIRNLLDAVSKAAAEQGIDAKLGHRKSKSDETGEEGAAGSLDRPTDQPTGRPIETFTDNTSPLTALADASINVLGATAWLWARPEYLDAVDVLFVDEAGQMSLANALAVAGAAKSLVLLGDPQQLEQPMQGSHPDGVGVSALQHILGDEQTMPEGRGLFLPVTWRLAPAICGFTSELFYESQLHPKAGLDRQVLTGTGRFDGGGLHLVGVEHEGNRNASDEEAAKVVEIVQTLLAEGSTWTDADGVTRQLVPDHLRVVAPFNAHVARVQEALAAIDASLAAVPVGTVDKFQGQEAPVVIYSMATSHPDDAPRGMEFLYSLNRLNVATSRARCAAVVVASPRLFEPECRTPRQMRLANALCRYRELARVVPAGGTS